ncbi:MAG: hypothetical protein WCA21_07195 [Terracidiphilus sp.]
MPATPIVDPVSGESLVGTEPQLLQQVDPGWWRQRLNLYTGRALTVSALDSEQDYRGGLLATLGQSVTAGTVNGLSLTMDLSGADPLLVVTPGYGITASGQDVVLNSTLKAHLSTLTVIDAVTGNGLYSFHQSVGDPTNATHAGILLLQPVIAQVSGQMLDTGTGPIIVSGNLGASCDQDPSEYAFEDWQIADAVRLVYLPWPKGVPALPLPAMTPQATWRNRLAYAIFEAESLLGPDDQLPWAMLGLPLALIAFDPGTAWAADTAFTIGQSITDPNSNLQLVTIAGTSAAAQPAAWNTVYGGETTDGSITWINNGLAWKPLFVDCSAVVRAGGLPRRRYVFPAQPSPLTVWQSKAIFAAGAFIIDTNNNVQLVQTAGTSGGPPPQWKKVFGQTTQDGSVTWIENGPASWQPNTAFAAGQFILDANGNLQHVLTAGSSAASEPNWNGIYLPTTDGSVTWINNGSGNPPIVQPALAQARINQLSEQLSQVMTQQTPFNTLADIFPTLPPSGILPVGALNFLQQRASWLPPNWTVSAAPVHLEELETVLETGMTLDLIAAETSAPTDATLLEPVEVLVPLPDALYDPDILIQETVAPIFNQEVTQATQARNLTLQELKAVAQQINALFAAAGPNLPANPNLIDPDAGLTPDEIAGRNAPPPYLPPGSASFGAAFQIPWQPASSYYSGYMVIDSNGNLQVAISNGASGPTPPIWNTNVGGTTTETLGAAPDGILTWLNNGPWTWQPDTAYVAGQFVIDPSGYIQSVITAGTSASVSPNWPHPEAPTQNTADGIVWQSGGKALWQPDILYAVGQAVLDVYGNIQIVQTGGISGDSVPAWSQNLNQTTQDGGVTWQNLGRFSWQPNTIYSAGQAVLDANNDIQIASIGGTSGAAPPAWTEGPNATTLDASVIWHNNGPITWQPNAVYGVGQIIIDSNGNIQYAKSLTSGNSPQSIGSHGNSGTVQPAWSTTPGGTTTDGSFIWSCLSFSSTDLQQIEAVASQAPYTTSFTDSTGTTHSLSLLTASDLTNLENNGLQPLITSLNARISQANDLLDTGFLTAQTDIYRYRQNVLGATAATSLATSPVLANIATGETASATAENLQTYISTVLPVSGSGSSGGGSAPIYIKPIINPINETVVPSYNLVAKSATFNLAAKTESKRTLAVKAASGNSTSIAANSGAFSSAPISQTNQSGILKAFSGVTSSPFKMIDTNLAASGLAEKFTVGGPSMTQGGVQAGPAQIIAPGINTAATSTDITSQSPLAGAQLNLRTLTIAQRLQQSPSQEAMFYSIGNRLSFLQTLQTLMTDLNLVVDDLQILMDGPPPAASTTPIPVPVEMHTFSEWRDATLQTAILSKIQSPYMATDSAEATLFSVGVRVVEQHTMLLRALEARVQQYSDFVGLCTTALNNIQNNIQQAEVYATQLQNNLLQDRQNVAFTSALLADETNRVQGVNAQRQQVLATSVQLIAYTRARTLQATDTAPSRQLVPANVANPVPACLQQSVSIPPELREIVGQLREAPINWLPSIAAQAANLERPVLLQQLAISTQARAVQMLQLPLLPSSAAGESGVYAAPISNIYTANQQIFRGFQVQRAAIQPAALANLSWSSQVASLQSIAAVNDLISSDSVHTEISNAVTRLIQQISSVATCLYTQVSIALPINRLAWAEYLRGSGISVQLQSLAVLPGWNQLDYTSRQQMQMLVDWLFLQIDTTNTAATAFMSDVVRTAILLASDVPIDNIISGNIIARVQPAVGGVVSLSLPSDRISSGMYVNLYSGATLAARAVVSDLDSATVRATVTDVFTPGSYLETSDTAHFTTLTPQAIALRPLFM